MGKYRLQSVTCSNSGLRRWNREEGRCCDPVLAGDLLTVRAVRSCLRSECPPSPAGVPYYCFTNLPISGFPYRQNRRASLLGEKCVKACPRLF